MRSHIIFTLALLTILLVSCRIPQPISSASVASIQEPLVVEIWANSDLAQVGQTIEFRATVTNNGARTQVIEIQDRPVFDISVGTGPPERRLVTRWSDGKLLTSELTRLELRGGESKTIEFDYLVRECCSSIVAGADFTYDIRVPGLHPSITVFVGSYPYGALP